MQKVILFIAAAALITASFMLFNHQTEKLSSVPWSFTTCGSGAVQTKSITLSQNPARNTKVGITISGVANSAVDLKQVQIVSKLDGIKVDTRSADFSQSFESGDNVNFVFTEFIPIIAPKGKYTIQFTFQDTNNNGQGCVSIQFSM